MISRSGGRSARTFIQGLAKIELGSAQRGKNTEEEASKNRDARREGQNPAVQADDRALGQAAGRDLEKRAESSPAEEQAQSSPRKRKNDAFRQKLTNDTSAACAHRGADSNLAAARGCTSEQEIRDVNAGNKKNKANGAEQE